MALSFLTSHVRDTQEYVRIAAYTVLAELGLAETQAVLEDGLLDASVLVRARAAEAIGKAGLAGKSGALRRALNDAMPAVRIAAMNALSEAKVTDIMPYLIEVARTDDGPEAVFAYAALYRLGKHDMLTDITGAATLPEPDVRMAALGVLGRLKRPSSLSVLSQGVYDPEPSVRAFAAGALGDYGQAGGVAPSNPCARGRKSRACAPLQPRVLDGWGFARISRYCGLSRAMPICRYGPAQWKDCFDWATHRRSRSPRIWRDTRTPLYAPRQPMHWRRPPTNKRWQSYRRFCKTSNHNHVFWRRKPGESAAPVTPLLKKGLQDSDVAVRLAAAGSLLQQLRRHHNAPKVR